MILLFAITTTGQLATVYLGNMAREDMIKESEASSLTVSTYISAELKRIEGAAQSLAGSPWIAPALISRTTRDIEHANSALDSYNTALNASVSYLIDVNGITVASSNRNVSESQKESDMSKPL